MEHIEESEYKHAKQVWNAFRCSTMKDYKELYMRLDAALLADDFENFRGNSLRHYQLDPTHFCIAPRWHACQKINLQLVSDPDISLFIDEGLLGGVSMVRNPHLFANNEEVPGYNESEEKKWLLSLDCNNQYCWVLSQSLPTGGFPWVDDINKFNKESILNIKNDESTGYYLELVLEYPLHLHQTHDE